MPTCKLTTKGAVDALSLPHGKVQELYWCTDLTGFGVVVGKRTKTFVVQRPAGKGRNPRVTIGRYGTITLHDARKQAEEIIGVIRGGVDPNEKRRAAAADNMTLREAWNLYKEHLDAKERSPRTGDEYWKNLKRYCADWLDRPLVEITRDAARKRHLKIGKENGKSAANATMVALRAIWRRVRRQHPALDAPPTDNVDLYKTQNRKEVIPYDKLPDWWAGVQSIQNPVRRDLYIWLLFTGTRSEEARTLRWDQVDLKAGTVHFPVTKTGAFTLPLSDRLVELLEARRNCKTTAIIFGDEKQQIKRDTFVFPALRSKSGHIEEAKLNEDEVELFPCKWTPHVLRHTYITLAANKVGISDTHRRLLVNHAVPQSGDAHLGYNHPEIDDLRRSQQAVTDAFWRAFPVNSPR